MMKQRKEQADQEIKHEVKVEGEKVRCQIRKRREFDDQFAAFMDFKKRRM